MRPIYSPHQGFPGDHVTGERCGCDARGTLVITERARAFMSTLPVEHVSTRCRSCGHERTFTFDTTAYTCKC